MDSLESNHRPSSSFMAAIKIRLLSATVEAWKNFEFQSPSLNHNSLDFCLQMILDLSSYSFNSLWSSNSLLINSDEGSHPWRTDSWFSMSLILVLLKLEDLSVPNTKGIRCSTNLSNNWNPHVCIWRMLGTPDHLFTARIPNLSIKKPERLWGFWMVQSRMQQNKGMVRVGGIKMNHLGIGRKDSPIKASQGSVQHFPNIRNPSSGCTKYKDYQNSRYPRLPPLR